MLIMFQIRIIEQHESYQLYHISTCVSFSFTINAQQYVLTHPTI